MARISRGKTTGKSTERDVSSGTSRDSGSAADRVYLGILEDLEYHRMVPGQRIVETDLAVQFGVGRHAVREALRQLAMRGVLDLGPTRPARIRKFDLHQTLQVPGFAGALQSLAAISHARHYQNSQDGPSV